ncbi:pentatricopeptide repeat-containing protein At4g14170 [Cannabis sativa]|uniref:pentatricopeptide repeat-containing protein At4g14170 n=1 Tax=Cannabis sativa TaxID=3483 RepID=UPI0029CA240E|nr:pentatricopeptide repeat-containing protein At4g14170 [Cannabis sativa]XP_030496829.2 pentatricopeptide repeat-containing protein At4g14170 [Cannabis sativa]XP_030496835.2 pentatricopeptide repeat-containing protein At4g14170 [Cannabis sativa]XP_060969346.1 pentatricopeptide repeat-containing protein At4g14170 [Cannabis sativa]XP_060969347.1 pentatricopeptide repeat-containing protein At4g14170 [Cannabis sativa]XP_060969348.1 pentatricopeptide repeat-containing protein At4g14170 [Cannabis s
MLYYLSHHRCSSLFIFSCKYKQIQSQTHIPIHPLHTLTESISNHSPNQPHSDLLPLVSCAQSLRQAKQAHALALVNGFLPRSVSLCASLILSYATFGAHTTCGFLFEGTIKYCRTAFLWNTLIRAYSIVGIHDGFRIYNGMVQNGVVLDDHTFPFVLKLCSDFLEFQKGTEIHGTVVKLGFGYDVFVGNTLLSFYGNCGNMNGVRKVFNEMHERDAVSWNTIIGVFSVNGLNMEALKSYREMNSTSGIRSNSVTVISVLPVCVDLEDELMARQIHCYVAKVGLDRLVTIGNALIDVYGKCRNVKASKKVFDEMIERNEVSWNAAITSLTYIGRSYEALDVFRSMINSGVSPNSITVSSMLPVFVELGFFKAAKEIHGFSIRMNIESDVFISNSLIDMYAKSGCLTAASDVFHHTLEKNIVSWNAMVANFAQNKLEIAAIELVRQMQSHGETPNSVTLTNVLPACSRLGSLRPGKEIHARAIRVGLALDLFVTNALIDMYIKCGYLSLAQNVFNTSLQDEVSYNTLIVGYSQATDCSESLKLFSEMKLSGMTHDTVSFVGVISACEKLGAIKHGKEVHGSLIRKLFHTHLFVANSLLDFYTKCGRIDLASKVFERIPDKDVTSWNTMILGYGMLGELDSAIGFFEAMRKNGVEHDSVSYIAVLSACSHGGLVEKGKKYFKEMQDRNVKPKQTHYACMVDLLGRAGLMEEASELIRGLPIVPDANVWGALLGACRIHGNVELGIWAAENLFRLKPQHSGYYILLSNMYAEAGRWSEANMVRELMKSRGVKKNPGCSWVQIRDRVHAFGVGDSLY